MVSVIVAVYNSERYIGSCIASILCQTFKNMEIIVIDDGSTDSTVKTVEELKSRDKRIKIFRQGHKGYANARNTGIKESKGKYIAFCDASNFYASDRALEKAVDICETNHVMVCGGCGMVLEGGIITKNQMFHKLRIKDEMGIGITFADYQEDYDFQNFIFNREMILDNNIFFPNYAGYEAPPFLVMALIKAGTFWVIPVPLCCCRAAACQEGIVDEVEIVPVLKGIVNNIHIALEYGFDKLYKRLIKERLNQKYLKSIIENMSDETLKLLNCIVKEAKEKGHIAELKALNDRQRYKECYDLVGKKDAYLNLYSLKNQSFEIWRKTALLATHGVGFADILTYMGIRELYVYGAGEIGRMFLSSIKGKVSIKAIIDKSNKQYAALINDNLPIIVTPAAFFQEISYEMINKGIRRERIFAIHTLLTIALKYPPDKNANMEDRKHFLIVGASFANKGAQSMLFTAVSEIRTHYLGAIIWYLPLDAAEQRYSEAVQDRYDMIFLTDGIDLKSQLYEIVPQLTAIINVAGYSLASFWDNEWYMRILRISYRYGIPMYLMPQSFGPFQFPEEKQEELKTYLPYVKRIYARETEAYEQMKMRYNLKNIVLSKDLVLQNKGLNKNGIYREATDSIKIPTLYTRHNVAIVPNIRNYEFGSRKDILDIYFRIINRLIKEERNIYIVPHSIDRDSEVCNDIYSIFKDCPSVYRIEEGMDCIEFEEFTVNFEYMIASRFHAIVHGYKNSIPSIAIGWADKYGELLGAFHQEKYLFDIRNHISMEMLMNAIDNMEMSFEKEAAVIKEVLPSMQRENCFDVLWENQGEN